MEVEWDGRKALANLRKHGIDFVDAVLVLHDNLGITVTDDSEGEERFITIGTDAFRRIIVVVYVWKVDRVRMISARHATARERRIYLEGK